MGPGAQYKLCARREGQYMQVQAQAPGPGPVHVHVHVQETVTSQHLDVGECAGELADENSMRSGMGWPEPVSVE